jgi:hypothetical protein
MVRVSARPGYNAQQIRFYLRLLEMRMIESNGEGSEKSVKILAEEAFGCGSFHKSSRHSQQRWLEQLLIRAS